MIVDHRRLDPRAKLAFAGSVTAVAIAIPRLGSLAALALLLVIVVGGGRGLTLRSWLGLLSPFKILVPVIFILNAFFYTGGPAVWRAPVLPVALTVGGIETSAIIAGRLLVIAAAGAWFAATTEAEEFEVALTSVGVPWGFAFLISLTLRLAPEMRARFRTIEEAQRARGLDLSGGPIARARARIPMLIPFLVAVIEYGYDLSEALVVRDFGRSTKRTHLVQIRHGPADYGLYLVSVLVVATFVGVFAT